MLIGEKIHKKEGSDHTPRTFRDKMRFFAHKTQKEQKNAKILRISAFRG